MLTDGDLKTLSKKMNFSLEGCFFKDKLPKKIKYNTGYIINLDDSMDGEGNSNEGSHWTCLQVNKYKDGTIEPIFFDPYGAPPSESVKDFVKNNCAKYLPYTNRDIQSIMNNACGWYVCAFLHYINCWENRTKDLYNDVNTFMSYFDDLNVSVDFKKNEWVLHHFFMDKDPTKRNEIDVFKSIQSENEGNGPDMMKIPIDINVRSATDQDRLESIFS
jgi:hypothetical protein